ncbi:MAG: hypothetical protein WA584_11645 [Pyrinomonadaceae bacterium]
MKNKSNIYLIFGLVVITSIITVTATIHSQTDRRNQNTASFIKLQQIENNDAPVLDYETELQKPFNQESADKSRYFNSLGSPDMSKQITELPPGVEPLPIISRWWIGLPALPVAQSSAVVVGEVTDTAAHFSDNKRGIYSEFVISVTEIFKDADNSINLKNKISANRVGGSVRFASGRINKYRIDKQGMPQKGERYFLFLNKISDGDYLILTGYKLSNGKIAPLDGENNKDPRSDLSFAQYRDADEQRLRQDLQAALQTVLAEGGGKQ